MAPYKYIIQKTSGESGSVILNRPEVHNALHIEMIREISDSVRKLNNDHSIRIIRFEAEGTNFSAGADLKWMKNGMEHTRDQLKAESRELAMLFNDIYNSSKLTISLLKGKVLGGANGIAAASDIAIATPSTSFAFTEVKLGLIPATIAPYIVRRTGNNVAKEWMLTGRKIDADEAYTRGLVNYLWGESEVERKVEELSKLLLENSPNAIAGIKEIFKLDTFSAGPDELIDRTAELIAEFRVSEEGQEGISAFFEKRKPGWIHDEGRYK